MRRLFAIALLLAPLVATAQNASGMQALLDRIRQDSAESARVNQEREARFLRNRNEQASLLQGAEAEQAQARARADAIRARYEANQKEIAELKAQLAARAGDYTQVAAMTRQAAADFRAHAADSFVTAQYPQRLEKLERLSADSLMPGRRDLEDLWFLLQQEMIENGQVARFSAEVIDATGNVQKQEVIRVGSFVAFSGDRYLVPQRGSAQLLALPRQPEGALRGLAEEFVEAEEPAAPILLDPTRGTLLAQEAERPTLSERIDQGGEVGYVIIVVGVLGAVLGIYQLVWLLGVGRRVDRQLQNLDEPRADNPLGRVLGAFKGDPRIANEDPEVIELRLSEAVLREVPRLERFQAFLRLAVAAGPLLGLIGTVVGMIITFQVITEQGAGDPRMMAAGISQAMVATLLGLGIAVPLLFMNSVLIARSRAITQILDEQATGLLAERLERRRA